MQAPLVRLSHVPEQCDALIAVQITHPAHYLSSMYPSSTEKLFKIAIFRYLISFRSRKTRRPDYALRKSTLDHPLKSSGRHSTSPISIFSIKESYRGGSVTPPLAVKTSDKAIPKCLTLLAKGLIILVSTCSAFSGGSYGPRKCRRAIQHTGPSRPANTGSALSRLLLDPPYGELLPEEPLSALRLDRHLKRRRMLSRVLNGQPKRKKEASLYVTLLGDKHPRLASRNKRQGVLETMISFGRSRSGCLCPNLEQYLGRVAKAPHPVCARLRRQGHTYDRHKPNRLDWYRHF